jgi:hypothetical protein
MKDMRATIDRYVALFCPVSCCVPQHGLGYWYRITGELATERASSTRLNQTLHHEQNEVQLLVSLLAAY